MPGPSEIEERIRALEAQADGLRAEAQRLRAELATTRGAPPNAHTTPATRRSWRLGFARTLLIFQIPTAISIAFSFVSLLLKADLAVLGILIGFVAGVNSIGGLITAGLELWRERKDPPPDPSLARALFRTLTFPVLLSHTVVLLAAVVAASFTLGGGSRWDWKDFFPVLGVGTGIELVGIVVPLGIYAFATHRREERAFNERRAEA
jgi:hypothetical protein